MNSNSSSSSSSKIVAERLRRLRPHRAAAIRAFAESQRRKRPVDLLDATSRTEESRKRRRSLDSMPTTILEGSAATMGRDRFLNLLSVAAANSTDQQNFVNNATLIAQLLLQSGVSPVEACSSSSGASGAPTTSSTGGNKSTSTTGGLRISGIVTREIRGDRRNPESLMSTIEVRCPRQSILPRSVSSAHPQTVNTGVDDYLKPDRFEHLLRKGPPDQHVQEQHSWNPEDRSLNIFVKDEDKFTFHRHPVAQSTDCIRGKIGYSRGFHVWQIEWPERQRGTHAVVGVATKAAPLHAVGYTALVGTTNESYGWDITRRQCHHDSKHTETWRYPYNVPSTYNVPDKFYCILDMDEGYMAFSTEDRYLGVAFRNLKGKTLYPIVAAVWGHCEISMRYLGSLEPEPLALAEVCRRSIRIRFGRDRIDEISDLAIPPVLKRFLLYQ